MVKHAAPLVLGKHSDAARVAEAVLRPPHVVRVLHLERLLDLQK